MQPTRRSFLQQSSIFAAAGVAAVRATAALAQSASNDGASPDVLSTPVVTKKKGDMFYRMLGKTGEEVSFLGIGGFHIGAPKDPEESTRIIRTAVDRGITFLDNCWDYHEGESEKRMGKALADGYRDKVFLMSKIDGRTRDAAAKQIDESLQRLKTDHVDLMQMHEVIRLEDPDRLFAEEGGYEALAKAKEAGKVRFIGFTGHKDPAVHLRMLDTAREHDVHFDTVQMPVNIMDAHFRSFTHQVLPRLVEEGIGPLAMKPFGGEYIVKEILRSGVAQPIELLHYSMSLPVSVVITGCDSVKILEQALEAARTFEPMDAAAREELVNRVKGAAAHGEFERYKTTAFFDSTAQHPEYLGPPPRAS
jgi:predicted aldo/keto reductase-like oxidoreductase